MAKTSIKKNLYWEIKDKVIEETFDGFRSQKKTAKVRVFGTDSCKEVRSRLIEILYDRVALHKDKFIAPILHHELESMEIKKSGKVEHADNAHDDQVFSYLMALYVWYDGIDLMERYGIRKNTIKTDEDIDIEDLSINNEAFGLEKVDVDSMVNDISQDDSELEAQLDYIAKSKSSGILYKEFKQTRIDYDSECLNSLLANNRDARKAYSQKYHIDLDDAKTNTINNQLGVTCLPDELFGNIDVDDDELMPNNNIVGNLANSWRNLIMK